MRDKIVHIRTLLFLAAASCLAVDTTFAGGATTPWVTAYYAGWSQGWFDNGVLPTANIDYSAVTHIIHFALVPLSDGSLDYNSNSIIPQNSANLVSRAHAAGKKVLICVGGWGSDGAFRGATSVLNLNSFVSNLVNFMTSRGYDGIDIDWEVLDVSDAAQYTLFITTLRTRLNQITPRPLLTAAAIWQPALFATLLNDFDQVNLMTYDLSGAWPGWIVWHNSPLDNGGLMFSSNGEPVPSATTMLQSFLGAGVPANKLGIGIDFYGYVWSGGTGTSTGGVTRPGQTWTSYPQVEPNVPYYSIIQNYYRPEYYQWDSSAHASYLSIDNPGSANDKFISYDNEEACRDKVLYATSHGLGGVFIWELGGGMLPEGFDYRDRLLQAVKAAAGNAVQVPSVPQPELPQQKIVGTPLQPLMTWSAQQEASWYHLQIAPDTTFSRLVADQPWIILSSFTPTTLQFASTYYWRVNASNSTAVGNWSATRRFSTTADTGLPSSWSYIGTTGSNATVLISSSANPKIGSVPLQGGDAIGVFFRAGLGDVCAGYGIWHEGQNLTVTAWGDDPQTPVKDGFSPGDTIYFKVWDHLDRREYEAEVGFQQGGPVYETDGIYILSGLGAYATMSQNIPLANGWNMISSYIAPNDSTLLHITEPIRSTMVLVKNNTGNVFWPDSNINTLKVWSVEEGYQIYVNTPDTLTIVGSSLAHDSIPISLTPGWNLKAYLRNSPMSIDSALASIRSSITIVKDNRGFVYWPAYGVNTIGELQPGQGYKIYASEPVTLVYPPRALPPPTPFQNRLAARSSADNSTTHYPSPVNTGNNCVVLFESNEMDDGDELAAWTSSRRLVGAAIAESGKVVLTIWGNDNFTTGVDGALDGEQLTCTYWSSRRQREDSIALHDIADAISERSLGKALRYHAESLLVAHIEMIPAGYVFAQNFPNPFNPSTTIRFGVPEKSIVQLTVYNLVGQVVETLKEGIVDAGIYDVRWRPRGAASGIYFAFIRAVSLAGPRQYSAVRKMLYVK